MFRALLVSGRAVVQRRGQQASSGHQGGEFNLTVRNCNLTSVAGLFTVRECGRPRHPPPLLMRCNGMTACTCARAQVTRDQQELL